RSITYAEAQASMQGLAQALLNTGLSAERPLVILSGNEIEHALLGLAAMLVGGPYAPLSPAYSLVSRDFAKLRHIMELLQPGLVYASDGGRFAAAIGAAVPPGVPLVVRSNPPVARTAIAYDALAATLPTPAVAAAN